MVLVIEITDIKYKNSKDIFFQILIHDESEIEKTVEGSK